MSKQDSKAVVFMDDDLIERLLRGDDPSKAGADANTGIARTSESGSLVEAVELASEGRLDDAIGALQEAKSDTEDSVEVRNSLGHLNFEKQDWTAAAHNYASVLEAQPNHPTAHYNLALCLERQANFVEASAQFAQALVVDPTRWQALWGRGRCSLRLGEAQNALAMFDAALSGFDVGQTPDRVLTAKAVALHQLGRFTDAGDLYDQLLRKDPESQDLLENAIALALTRQDAGRAKELSERLLKLRPESRQALEGLSSFALSRGDYSAAQHYCSRLVEVASDSYEGWFNLGLAYQKTGRLEQAASAYTEAVRIRPDATEANSNLGVVLQERGDLSGARHAYEKALQASPDSAGVLWNLALIAEREGDSAQAQHRLEKLVGLRADWQDATFRLGYLRLQSGDHAGAVDNFADCLKRRPDWLDAHVNLGLAWWKLGDLTAAAEALQRAVAGEPQNQVALQALTAIATERRDHALARETYRKLEPSNARPAELSYNLGLLLQAVGDSSGAAECYQSAVDSHPEFADALVNLGHALIAEGKEAEAKQAWGKAVAVAPELAGAFLP